MELCGNNDNKNERLLNTITIALEYIYMDFDTNKCAHIAVKAKQVSVGMELLSEDVIPELESYKVYKYLDSLKKNDIIQTEMKVKIPKKCYKRVR